MISASIVIQVTPLTDNDIWFANAAAWNNYWANVSGEVTLTPATTTAYIPLQFDSTKLPANINIDTIPYVLATNDMFNSLLQAYVNLDQSYQTLRGQLFAAGFISQI